MKVFLTTVYPTEWTYLPTFLRLAEKDRFRVHQLVDNPDSADIILFVDARQEHGDWRLDAIRRHPLVTRYRERAFLYNEMDQPWCTLPGLYVSMPRNAFNRQRQRACSYVIQTNPFVGSLSEQIQKPDLLFSFMGRRCHWTRERILQFQHPRAVIEDTSAWNFFGSFPKDRTPQQQAYAHVIGRSKFVVCPRGTGTASFRLFEALAAGRVPIIVSDEWVPPEGPDWERCALRVPEAQVDRVPAVAEANERHFEALALAARHEWDQWFAEDVLFHRLVEGCCEILRARRVPEALWQRVKDVRFLRLGARSLKGQLREKWQYPKEKKT